jgi:hypothetical protein
MTIFRGPWALEELRVQAFYNSGFRMVVIIEHKSDGGETIVVFNSDNNSCSFKPHYQPQYFNNLTGILLLRCL